MSAKEARDIAQERRREVMRRVEAGETLREIGSSLGKSVERIRQIFYNGQKIGRDYWHVWTPEEQAAFGDAHIKIHPLDEWRERQRSVNS